MRLAAVCAIFGDYDLIPPVPAGFDDCVLVTDRPVRTGWRNVVVTDAERASLAVKRPKTRPDLFTDCDASVWLDGVAHVRDDRFAARCRTLLEVHELVLWDHPEDRDCLYQEAEACLARPDLASQPLQMQVARYAQLGMPAHFGLWATGAVARRHTAAMREFGDAWWEELENCSTRDQVSLPFVLWRRNLTPGSFGLPQFDTDLIDWLPHRHEISGLRIAVPRLEFRIVGLEAEVRFERGRADEAEARYARLLQRRAVRIALQVAGWFQPVFRRLRSR